MEKAVTEYKIEKNIPIPASRSKYPFNKMEIGESVFFEYVFGLKARSAADSYGRAHKKRFVSRKVESGLRVWRVE